MMMRIRIKNAGTPFRALLWLPLALAVFSCNQDHIFYQISEEEPPKAPLIGGTPTGIVCVKEEVYATSSGNQTVYRYKPAAPEPKWEGLPPLPGGAVRALAGTNGALYALGEAEGGSLYRLNGTSWDKVSLEGLPEYRPTAIYGAGDTLLAGLRTSASSGEIGFTTALLKEGGGGPVLAPALTGELKGAAFRGGNYYAAAQKGLFVIKDTGGGGFSAALAKDQSGNELSGNMVGVLALSQGIVAVRRDGLENCYLLFGDGEVFDVSAKRELTLTGALGVWKDAGGKEALLLLGIQGRRETTTHGYRELTLDGEGKAPVNAALVTPGSEAVTSVENFYKYDNGIGKYPVLSIFQVKPGLEGLIFAATSRNGLWSYRERADGWSWNAED